MSKSKHLFIAFLLVFGTLNWAQQTPAAKQSEAISITGATAHIGDGTVVENATIVFEDGRITALGSDAVTKGTPYRWQRQTRLSRIYRADQSAWPYRGKCRASE